MRRLVLPLWLTALVLVTAWLRDLPTGGDPTFSAAKTFALAAGAYLLVATVATLALALCRVRVRLPLVPMLVVASLGAPLIGAPAFATTPTSVAPTPPVMHRVSDAPTPPPLRAQQPAPAPVLAPALPTSPAPATTWTVRHGQCFWSIASMVVRAREGRPPTNSEIAAYWRLLMAANTARLVHPGNPGLLFAGQELVLPPA